MGSREENSLTFAQVLVEALALRQVSSFHPQTLCAKVLRQLSFATFQTYVFISYFRCFYPCEYHTLFSRNTPNLRYSKYKKKAGNFSRVVNTMFCVKEESSFHHLHIGAVIRCPTAFALWDEWKNAINPFHFLIHNFVYRSSVTIYLLLLDNMQGGYE